MNTSQDVTSACSHMRGIGLVFDSVTHRAVWAVSAAETFFVGLMTNPTMAVVDIAAQDGLIGSIALSRLKEELRQGGLKVAWIPHKRAQAHGVGGAAKIVGSAPIPLGIHGTSGVLEVTVVEGDIPLLLPVKLLRELQATIDIFKGKLHFECLQVTVDLQTLPRGHIAIDVLSFGERGFVCPAEALKAGLSDSDFRWTSGSESAGTKMNLLSCAVFNQGSSGAVPPCFSASRRRCGDGSCEAFAKHSPSVGELAHSLDKAVEQLPGRGEWVHSWLPQASVENQYLAPSSEQPSRRRSRRWRMPAVLAKPVKKAKAAAMSLASASAFEVYVS